MNYCDFHCDALTATGARQITRQTLTEGGCLFQCFAAFVSTQDNPYACANALIDKFDALCIEEGYNRVRRCSDLKKDKINAMLTVEGGGVLEGRTERLDELYARGVRIFGLLWNEPNELGFSNFINYQTPNFSLTAREDRGLTPFGFKVVERMLALGMVPDCAHASDGVFNGVAEVCAREKKPFIVTHTGSNRVYNCARNLKGEQLKKIADSGGVAGLYFCAHFLSRDTSESGQRAALLAHARAMMNAGGEDILVLGSDFDGIPPNAYLPDCALMPALYDDFVHAFGSCVADKVFYKNALAFLRRAF